MIRGFSTLGAPELSFEESAALAREFGLDFLELRALGNTLDLPGYFRSRGTPALAAPVRVLGSSLKLTDHTEADVEAFLQLAELAGKFRAPYLRVFGGGDEEEEPDRATLKRAAVLVRRLRESMAESGLDSEILLETHDGFCVSERCCDLNDLLDEPLGLLWDSHHTWRIGGETPVQTWEIIGEWVRHVHYKDSASGAGSFHYVLPGEGGYPHAELFRLLREKGYDGGVSLEWEKLWHPELGTLREALEKFEALGD